MPTITTTALKTSDDPEVPVPLSPDPYRLSAALKSPAEIEDIAARHKRAGLSSRLPFTRRNHDEATSADATTEGPVGTAGTGGGGRMRRRVDYKGVQEFYQSQNRHITKLLKSVDEIRAEKKQEEGDNRLRFLIAVHGSLAANILLSALQLYAAISSGSLSLFATMADSIFDPISNLLLIFSHRAVNRVDATRFPSGKARLETAGNIGFSFLMITVSVILVVMSARDLAEGSHSETNEFHLVPVIAVAIALATKVALFLYCWGLRDKYSQVRILWEDHRNDLPVNAFGLFTSIAGAKLAWWVDPMGAIIIGVVIFAAWAKVVYTQSLLLVGVAADQEMRGLITYISMTHSDRITHIDTVRAYHAGPRIIVEVDIVMPEDAMLRETHDVAESLQIKLEALPDVERAYVHVDYEVEHKPEHSVKKEL